MSNKLYNSDLQLWEYPVICPFGIDEILDEDFYGVW